MEYERLRAANGRKSLMRSFVLAAIFLATAAAFAAPSSIKPTDLKCEYRTNPLGIDRTAPRLSWILEASNPSARDLLQSAYQVLAASNEEILRTGKGDLWDSGKVAGNANSQVVYQGKPLKTGMPVFWRVRVWDQAGAASDWSPTARWSMGMLEAADWKAKWIGKKPVGLYRDPDSPFQQLTKANWIWFSKDESASKDAPASRLFRTSFQLPANRTVLHAIFVLGAANSFDLEINGKRAGRGSSVQMPEILWVEDLLTPGSNSISVRVKRSAKPAGLIGALRVEFTNGAPLEVLSGDAWECSGAEAGPWTKAQVLGAYGMKPWGEVGFVEANALPGRALRKEFEVKPGLTRATAYMSGLGLSELYLNGGKIGDAVLSPGLTEYEKRAFYVTYDVTGQLKPGRNGLGVLLGNGRYWAPRGVVPIASRSYGPPKLCLQMEIEYADGKRDVVVSDGSWKLTEQGPLRANNEYDGEVYDARAEADGWARAGFKDDSWQSVEIVDGPAGRLAAQMAEPLRVVEDVKPIKISTLHPGVQVVDLGQNMVGWVRLKVQGKAGTTVMLRFAETLKPDGYLYIDNLRSARATDFYTLKGSGIEIWEPRFTYHGFRYVEVTGYPGTLTAEMITGRVVQDAMQRAGSFETSDSMLNRIHKNIYWGIRGNYRSIPTDCPQRDERQGWLGDRSVVSRSESYMFDVAAFYNKWVQDIEDSQKPSGSVPDVSPAYWVLYNDGIVWPSTYVLAPNMLLEQYGDLRAIELHYPAMKLWITYMRGFLQDGIMPKNTYGDWCVPPEKPELIHSQDPARVTSGALLSTAYYYKMLTLMSRYAGLLGKTQDQAEFSALASTVKTAFLKKYFKPQDARFDNGTQTSSVLPLAFGMVPDESREAVFASLVRKIEKESDNHVGVGLVGAQWLMRTLSDNGRADLAFTIAKQNTYPGWGYMVEKGATTVWELWNGDTADPAMNSGNHVMQIGDLGVWMYEYLGGIRSDTEKRGFEHVIIKPYAVQALTFAKASHLSPRGEIRSAWRREGDRLVLDVSIPPTSTATVYVPTQAGQAVKEKGGAKQARSEPGYTVYEVGSGSYSFTSAR
jgi:alpha-L-rhamnosidase